jgi:hypothetical protein
MKNQEYESKGQLKIKLIFCYTETTHESLQSEGWNVAK